jgi:hypothetical protein
MEKYKYIEPKFSDLMLGLLDVLDDPGRRLSSWEDGRPPLPKKVPAVEDEQ